MVARRRNPARGRIDLRNPLTDHTLNNGRVAWWLTVPQWFGGGTWYDLVNAYAGTLTGFTGNVWTPSSPPSGNGSLSYNILNTNYVSGPSTLNITGPFSLSLWVNPRSNATTQQFADKRDAGGNNGFYLLLNAGQINGQVQFGVQQGSGADVNLKSTIYLAQNQWQHVVGVCTGSQLLIYVNAQAAGSISTTNHPTAGTGNFRIGTQYNGGFPYGGYLNDLSLWRRALSAPEVFLDYELSQQGYPGVLNRVSPATWSVPAAPVFQTPPPLIVGQSVPGAAYF